MVHVQGLRCRECGREYDARSDLHLRVVLRPARGRLRLRRDRRRSARDDRGRARRALWRYSDLLPVAARRGGRPRHRLHAARARRPARGRARPAASCGSRTTPRNPTNSFKDRVVSVALSKALEFGFKVAACASHRQPRELGRRARGARRAAQRTCSSRRPRAGQGRHDRGLRRQRSSRSTATTTT